MRCYNGYTYICILLAQILKGLTLSEGGQTVRQELCKLAQEHLGGSTWFGDAVSASQRVEHAHQLKLLRNVYKFVCTHPLYSNTEHICVTETCFNYLDKFLGSQFQLKTTFVSLAVHA